MTGTLRPQHHFRRVEGRLLSWEIARLLRLAAELPVIRVPLAELREIDEPYWFGATGDLPTSRRVMEHARQVEGVDLSFPILLCAEGRIMDGMHRVMKAHGLGHETIAARRFAVTPEPDRVDVRPGDLGYG